MYNNIGNKIKALAIFSAIIGIIGSIVAAIVLFCSKLILNGVLVLVGGVVLSWVATFALYGFGELLIKVTNIEESVKSIRNSGIVNENNDNGRKVSDPENKNQKSVAPEIQSKNNSSVTKGNECPFCYGKISNQDTICPNCGNKLK